jgi:hypothetical protein
VHYRCHRMHIVYKISFRIIMRVSRPMISTDSELIDYGVRYMLYAVSLQFPRPEPDAFLLGSRLSCTGGEGPRVIPGPFTGIPNTPWAEPVAIGDIGLANSGDRADGDRWLCP